MVDVVKIALRFDLRNPEFAGVSAAEQCAGHGRYGGLGR